MNEQKKREAMARLEGYESFKSEYGTIVWCKKGIGLVGKSDLPTYDSHDDVQRVIDGLDSLTLVEYMGELEKVVYGDYLASDDKDCGILKATPAQKVEAILRAKGVWDE